MSELSLSSFLSKDHKLILKFCYLYTEKSKYSYLQYTAAGALICFPAQKIIFNNTPDLTLVYYCKKERRYL